MTPKDLKKLADACRKAGIKHYKNGEIEFTLSDDLPQKESKRTQSRSVAQTDDKFESGLLDPMDMLFWSATAGSPLGKEDEENIA
jgi:hypothetical protein